MERTDTYWRLLTSRLRAHAEQRRHGIKTSRNTQQNNKKIIFFLVHTPLLLGDELWIQTTTTTPGADNPEGIGVQSMGGVLEGVGGKGTGTRM
jgi:hypothetical protein